jgi:hypothetical protein
VLPPAFVLVAAKDGDLEQISSQMFDLAHPFDNDVLGKDCSADVIAM